ncbi:MAG TPA: prepilin-type N-terminal cleavage/methylation domain-containing protein [Acetobacteraceae bacterium]|nr:prepilin-type N-terminal cleavage/methylation domain-containing protein [Acetobacteraceae bacterium]
MAARRACTGPRDDRGFTWLEVLVALVITLAALGVLPFNRAPVPERQVLLDGVSHLRIGDATRAAPGTWPSGWGQPVLPGPVRIHVTSSNGADTWPAIIAQPQGEQPEQ